MTRPVVLGATSFAFALAAATAAVKDAKKARVVDAAPPPEIGPGLPLRLERADGVPPGLVIVRDADGNEIAIASLNDLRIPDRGDYGWYATGDKAALDEVRRKVEEAVASSRMSSGMSVVGRELISPEAIELSAEHVAKVLPPAAQDRKPNRRERRARARGRK